MGRRVQQSLEGIKSLLVPITLTLLAYNRRNLIYLFVSFQLCFSLITYQKEKHEAIPRLLPE